MVGTHHPQCGAGVVRREVTHGGAHLWTKDLWELESDEEDVENPH